jgi:hypothetical protein
MRGFCSVTTGPVVNDKRDKVGKGLKHLKIMTSFMDDPLCHFSVSQNKWCDKEDKERKRKASRRTGWETLVTSQKSIPQKQKLAYAKF